MIAALARFVDALRAERHAVSPAEIVDAARALDLVGLERRADVRFALRATLAKDRKSAEAFDRLFDAFFTAPRLPAKGRGDGRPAAEGERPRGRGEDRSAASPEKPKKKAEPKPKPRPRDHAPIESKREGDTVAEILDRTRRDGERRHGRLRRARLRDAPLDDRDPARRDLARRMTTEAERQVAQEVPKIVQALKLRVGRRHERSRSGRPWLRRVLRDNLKAGGVPFVIPYRAPKTKSTRVVLLVDVSFSVARAAGLFLLMAEKFLALGRRARVLAFVDRPVDATAAVSSWARGSHRGRGVVDESRRLPRRGARPGDGIRSSGVSFADVLDGLRDLNLEAPSDYGGAFHALSTSRLRPRGRDTLLVVLGDGRTNRFEPLPWTLAELRRGCRGVLWLVPEPRSRWGTADSALPAYLKSVDLVVEATDLEGLAAGLGELVRRL
jgi:uncharacterized protein with von Willebrand factor type A (vWA) domain